MEFPRLANHALLLWCGPRLRIGVHSGLVLPSATQIHEEFLRALDGRTSVLELTRRFPQLDSAEIQDLLAQLATAKLLEQKPLPQEIFLTGQPQIALPLLDFLDGSTQVEVTISVELARKWPTRTGVGVRPDGRTADLIIWAVETAEPDWVIRRHLNHSGQPHLLARSSAVETVIGPLVQPGTTACPTCLNLHQAARDPDWAFVVDALTRIPATGSENTCSWAAGTAAHYALEFLNNTGPSLRDTTIHLNPQTSRIEFRRWRQHPRCHCGRRAA